MAQTGRRQCASSQRAIHQRTVSSLAEGVQAGGVRVASVERRRNMLTNVTQRCEHVVLRADRWLWIRG